MKYRFDEDKILKEVGDYTADIRLHRNVSITLPFKVIAE